jgi:hypothetical protein
MTTTIRIMAVGLVAGVLGCGQPSGTVRGEVSLDGVPLAEGSIRLVPLDGAGPTAGSVIAGGAYAISNAPVGSVRVEITAPAAAGKVRAYDAPGSPMIDLVQERIPARYNVRSELRQEVMHGANTFDFALASK